MIIKIDKNIFINYAEEKATVLKKGYLEDEVVNLTATIASLEDFSDAKLLAWAKENFKPNVAALEVAKKRKVTVETLLSDIGKVG